MEILYIHAKDMVTIDKKEISLETIAEVAGNNKEVTELVKKIQVSVLLPEQGQQIIHMTDVIDCIHQGFPEAIVLNLGETDVIVRWKKKQENKKMTVALKVLLVSVVVFFGAGFTIIAFHNDIGIDKIFSRVYQLITGKESDGATILELTYSIGLLWGIVYFFHRFGRKTATTDPTPIEVAMRTYEKEVNQAIVENDQRMNSEGEAHNK